MRLLIICDTYPPARTSGAILLQDLATELNTLGNKVFILTPGRSSTPLKINMESGVHTLRVPMPPLKGTNYIARSLNELLISRRLFAGMRRAKLSVVNWDGIIWYSPSIFLGPIARRLMRTSKCSGYLVLRDIFPDWAVDMGLMSRGLAYRFFKYYELLQYRAAPYIGIQSSSNESYFLGFQPELREKIEVLDNWLGEAILEELPKECLQLKDSREFKIVYAGNMGVAQGLSVFIDAMEILKYHREIKFIFIGRGSEKEALKKKVASSQIENVEFFEEVSPEELNALLKVCDLGIVSLDVRHRTHNIPGKFLAYLRAGLPVIAKVNPNNEMIDIIREYSVGVVFDTDDPVPISESVLRLSQNHSQRLLMSSKAIELFEKRFSVRLAAQKILKKLKC